MLCVSFGLVKKMVNCACPSTSPFNHFNFTDTQAKARGEGKTTSFIKSNFDCRACQDVQPLLLQSGKRRLRCLRMPSISKVTTKMPPQSTACTRCVHAYLYQISTHTHTMWSHCCLYVPRSAHWPVALFSLCNFTPFS